MLILLFEVTPRENHVEEYLALAAELRPELDALGGCLFLDRYRSLAQPRKILSFQVWRDEAALTRWRVHHAHHRTQTLGRVKVFEDYRLRVAALVRVEAAGEATWETTAHGHWTDPAVRAPRFVAVAESGAPTLAGAEENFESIYRPGEFAHVVPWTPGAGAVSLASLSGVRRLRIAEIERDYGMHERAEAPQYFAPVPSQRPS